MTDLAFPSVTICSPGLNMEAVKEAILDDFDKWMNETGGNYKEQLDDFMEEKYARTIGEKMICLIKKISEFRIEGDVEKVMISLRK